LDLLEAVIVHKPPACVQILIGDHQYDRGDTVAIVEHSQCVADQGSTQHGAQDLVYAAHAPAGARRNDDHVEVAVRPGTLIIM
jgi:hypothetical protein